MKSVYVTFYSIMWHTLILCDIIWLSSLLLLNIMEDKNRVSDNTTNKTIWKVYMIEGEFVSKLHIHL